MIDTTNRTIVASILFLDIVEYSKQSVTDQMLLKQRFNALLVEALKDVAVNDRIVLDTGDGAAVSFMGTPEDSLFAAMHLRDAVAADVAETGPPLLVRYGINLGPVRLIKDINGQLNIIGDGINVAQRVMSFAEPGAILVSRSYYEVVSRLSDDYAKIFKDAGTRTDKHVREHAVYAIGETLDIDHAAAAPASPAAPATTDAPAPSATSATPSAAFPLKYLLAGGAALAVVVAGIGLSLRSGNQESAAPAAVQAADPGTTPANKAALRQAPSGVAKPSPPTVASAAKPGPGAPAPAAKSHEGKTVANDAAAATKTVKTSLSLAIRPWGEVYVDGKMKGVSPPLKHLPLPVGTHTIEIRNTTFPSYVRTLDAKPGVESRIEHKF